MSTAKNSPTTRARVRRRPFATITSAEPAQLFVPVRLHRPAPLDREEEDEDGEDEGGETEDPGGGVDREPEVEDDRGEESDEPRATAVEKQGDAELEDE
jgi:hypothetical protein